MPRKAPVCCYRDRRACSVAAAWILLATVVPFVVGENFIQVHVALEGSFFNPSQIAASEGDVVTFIFEGDMHDVTQSSFDKPCQPLPGGFGSGLSGRSTNGSAPAPTWDLRITNASQPIWFYCGASRPVPHCASGMVGVINSPSNQLYLDYVAAAKQLNLTTLPLPSVALSGVGAVATAPPLVPPSASTASNSTVPPQSSPTVNITMSPTVTQTTVSTSSFPVGATIGVAVGGAIVLAILMVLCYFVYRGRRAREDTVFPFYSVDNNQDRDVVSPGRQRSMSESRLQHMPSNPQFGPDLVTVSPMGTSHTSTTEVRGLETCDEPAKTGTQDQFRDGPPRRVRPLPPQPGQLVRRPSNHSVIPGDQDPGQVNIGVLAREVAAILQSSPGTRPQLSTTKDSLQPKWQRYGSYSGPSREPTPAPPPHYRLE